MTRPFKATRASVDGHTFASKGEAGRYGTLLQMQRAGLISDLVPHPPKLWLHVNGVPVLMKSPGYPKGRRVSYTPDFSYTEEGKKIIEEFKGAPQADTRYSRLKRGMVEAIHGIEIRVVYGRR